MLEKEKAPITINLKTILMIILLISCAGIVATMAPVVTGDRVLDEPLTNSQLSAIVAILTLIVSILFVRGE